jgi:hypothetical protein
MNYEELRHDTVIDLVSMLRFDDEDAERDLLYTHQSNAATIIARFSKNPQWAEILVQTGTIVELLIAFCRMKQRASQIIFALREISTNLPESVSIMNALIGEDFTNVILNSNKLDKIPFMEIEALLNGSDDEDNAMEPKRKSGGEEGSYPPLRAWEEIP